jgi:hypothetical protein
MKIVFKTILPVMVLTFVTSAGLLAQQKSVITLILESFNSASQGFPLLIKDTARDWGGWDYKISNDVVKQYAGVRDIKMSFQRNYKSLLLNDTLVQLNQMMIRGETIMIPEGKTWEDYKDTLTSYYKSR